MLTKISIENFKGIGSRINIDLKPITLFFGANSAGKSTIIQALLFVREILERNDNNYDIDKTLHGGDSISLGGFKNIVHNHQLDKIIKIKVDFSLSSYGDGLPNYPASENLFGQDFLDWQIKLDEVIENVSMEIWISWDHKKQQPLLSRYQCSINGNEVATISFDELKRFFIFEKINTKHSIFKSFIFENRSFEESYDSINKIMKNIPLHQSSALPDLDESLHFNKIIYFTSDEEKKIYLDFLELLNPLVLGISRLIKEKLQSFWCLGPYREIPSRNYLPSKGIDNRHWSNGLIAWDVLFQENDEKEISKINYWLDYLKIGYNLKIKKFKEIELNLIESLIENSPEVQKHIAAAIQEIQASQKLFLIEKDKNIELHPLDVGIGISQLLPVIVAAVFPLLVVAIEQPELHLHPAAQVGLGDLFIAEAGKNKGRIFLIETHSEHLILRLLRRIRETSEGKKDFPLTPEQLSVLYVQSTPNGTEIKPLPIDKDGEFTERWPKGFFAERIEELM